MLGTSPHANAKEVFIDDVGLGALLDSRPRPEEQGARRPNVVCESGMEVRLRRWTS